MANEIKFAPSQSMPLIALSSFPRSGNTWTRYMMQIASQIYTTSVYWETERTLLSSLALKGSFIDFRTGRGILVKSHLYDANHVRDFEGAILLIRNPYESSISEFFRCQTYLKVQSQELTRSLIQNKSVEWLVSVKSSFQKWHDLNLSWIKNSKKLLIVYYEELALNPEKELIRMLSFLGQPVNMERIRCATQTYPLRNRTHLDAVPFYPPIVKNYVTSLNNTLIDRQARPLPSYHE
ncbi:putative WSC domain-containing protein 2 [Apostichopus japonicus]|uniref:Putative WSC domain-containing protein 2 n=1 Tax=Stichopus japonicus TaxID=307972 RepID=A0A2G8KDF3_STIJA|nr:putative WSC domain-containing protein 2 [Apostichopus japonicus]